MSGRQLAYQVIADVEASAAAETGVATLLLDLRRAAGERPALTLPAGMRLRETRPTTQGTLWVLDCRPGRHRLTLAGKLASGPAQVPAVTIGGAGETRSPVRRFVSLAPGVRSSASTGLQPANLPANFGRNDVKAWQAVADNWDRRVSGGSDGGRGRLIADVAAAASHEGSWFIRANCLAFAEPGAAVGLPEGAELLVARLEGLELPRGGEPARLALPASTLEARQLTLVWQTPPLGE